MNEAPARLTVLLPPHARLLRWAVFDPPLRRRTVPACCPREVRCELCGGTVLGVTKDPVDALLIAWRHAKDVRRSRRVEARRSR